MFTKTKDNKIENIYLRTFHFFISDLKLSIHEFNENLGILSHVMCMKRVINISYVRYLIQIS